MKISIITIAFLFGTVLINAQKSKPGLQVRENIVSSEDPHNPLVNGIPYNQYKAQVQAEEKKRAAAEMKAREEAAAKKVAFQRNIETTSKEQSVKENK